MRFTNGYWLDREGYTVQRGREVHDLQVDEGGTAPRLRPHPPGTAAATP